MGHKNELPRPESATESADTWPEPRRIGETLK